MTNRSVQLQLGLGACIASLFLIFVAIPGWVASPTNVRNIILSPLFWPYVLAGLTGLTGLGLLAVGWFTEEDDVPLNDAADKPHTAWLRLFGLAAIMVVTMLLLPRIGMVWTSMLAFVATAFTVRTRHPIAAVICAIVIPLVLYAFFAHVAGVAIPQGHFVRLP